MSETHNTTSNHDTLRAEPTDGPGPAPVQTALCPVAELDRQVEAAMDAFNAAEEKLLAGPLSAAHRVCLEMERDKAQDRADGLRYAMTFARAESRGGLLVHFRELAEVLDELGWAPEIKAVGREYEADKAARLVKLMIESFKALMPDDAA